MLSTINRWALQLACSVIIVAFLLLFVMTLFAEFHRADTRLTMSWITWAALGAAVLAVRWLLFGKAHREDIEL